MKIKKKRKGSTWSISEILGITLIVSLVGYTAYLGLAQWLEDKLLDSGAARTNAVIINERNYTGNSPVSQTYTYSYMFEVSGKAYKEDSRDSKFSIGDTVMVEYLPSFPRFNRLAKD